MSGGTISLERYRERLEQARNAATRAAALLIGAGPDLRWLIGYEAMPLKRLTMLVISPDRVPTLVVPRLEAGAASAARGVAGGLVELRTWTETEVATDLVASLVPQARPSLLLVSDRLPAAFLLGLRRALPTADFGLASTALGELRAAKDADEVALLRRAAYAADRALLGVAGGRLVGRSERDVAREVRERLVAEGHDEAAFWIVGSGPNSASPHHEASDREIRPAEPIVLDIGGRIEGYGSDITRTIWVTGGDPAGEPEADFRQLYEVLRAAQSMATAAVAPGVPCEAIDAAARQPIEAAGYGEAFFHRTGHGIGLEGHEDPYIVVGNTTRLAPGHAFSVEPGIYLEGRYGARIEDIVVCSADGPDSLNQAPRELLVVSGLG